MHATRAQTARRHCWNVGIRFSLNPTIGKNTTTGDPHIPTAYPNPPCCTSLAVVPFIFMSGVAFFRAVDATFYAIMGIRGQGSHFSKKRFNQRL
jgi:hypothetical protein